MNTLSLNVYCTVGYLFSNYTQPTYCPNVQRTTHSISYLQETSTNAITSSRNSMCRSILCVWSLHVSWDYHRHILSLTRNSSPIYLWNILGCNAVAAISTDYFQNGGFKQGNIFKRIHCNAHVPRLEEYMFI